mmetsp:Transcript_14988/g.62380  ORF Transcript_14988/g.62380 Transcript_14988/m.62380 type:complete len:356 (+) Transcript_14988:768-1835(+)
MRRPTCAPLTRPPTLLARASSTHARTAWASARSSRLAMAAVGPPRSSSATRRMQRPAGSIAISLPARAGVHSSDPSSARSSSAIMSSYSGVLDFALEALDAAGLPRPRARCASGLCRGPASNARTRSATIAPSAASRLASASGVFACARSSRASAAGKHAAAASSPFASHSNASLSTSTASTLSATFPSLRPRERSRATSSRTRSSAKAAKRPSTSACRMAREAGVSPRQRSSSSRRVSLRVSSGLASFVRECMGGSGGELQKRGARTRQRSAASAGVAATAPSPMARVISASSGSRIACGSSPPSVALSRACAWLPPTCLSSTARSSGGSAPCSTRSCAALKSRTPSSSSTLST